MAFDAATGSTRWSWVPTACAAQSDQTVCLGGPWTPVEGPLVYVADPNAGRLVALDPATGVERWSFAVEAQAGPWAVSTGDGTVPSPPTHLPLQTPNR